MMIIMQVLNEHAAMVSLSDQRRAVVCGANIGREHRPGDRLLAQYIQHIYYLDHHTTRATLQVVLRELPLPVVTSTYEILAIATNSLHMHLADYQYAIIAAFIADVSRQVAAGEYHASRAMVTPERYPLEFAVAQRALPVIQANLGVSWPRSSVRALAQQLIPRPVRTATPAQRYARNVRALNQSIVGALREHGINRMSACSGTYDRLMVHVQYLAERQRTAAAVLSDETATMLAPFADSYPHAVTIARELFQLVVDQLGGMVNECELLYLALHVQRITGERAQSTVAVTANA